MKLQVELWKSVAVRVGWVMFHGGKLSNCRHNPDELEWNKKHVEQAESENSFPKLIHTYRVSENEAIFRFSCGVKGESLKHQPYGIHIHFQKPEEWKGKLAENSNVF